MTSALFSEMSDFITRFFEEKGLDNQVYEVKSLNGTHNILCTDDVVWALKQASGTERQSIERVLRELDRRNGDVHHFLKHMAQGVAISMPF